MKQKIERTLFWFKDRDTMLIQLNEKFFPYANLLNRLLNSYYEGKKIEFINLYFVSEETFIMYPALQKGIPHFSGGHLKQYDPIDFSDFYKKTDSDQVRFIWNEGCNNLKKAAQLIKNKNLEIAVEKAHEQGIELQLNPDYRVISSEVTIHGENMLASVWINFFQDSMTSKLTLEKEGELVFEHQIDKTKLGVEFFLEMYKKVYAVDNVIIIEGRKDVDYLPLKVPIDISIHK